MNKGDSAIFLKMKEQETEIQKLKLCNQTLSALYNNVRGFKHDFSNFIQALNGYAQLNDMAGIKGMVSAVMKECCKVNNVECFYQKNLENPAICCIIANKYSLAAEEKIKMNIEIGGNLKEISNSQTYEICRVLGILLDNAIEAARDSIEKFINVNIQDDRKNRRKMIIIENSYHNKEVDLGQIFELGYSSKKMEKEEHGIGLWNIRQILSQNQNLNLFTSKGDLFKQQLEIIL